MSKRDKIEKPPEQRGKTYELYVDRNGGELEHLTLARLIDLGEAPREDIPPEKLTALACRIYDTRRTRARFFNNSLLGEPVWDMLLALYCLPSRGQSLSVTGLCHTAGVPMTTGLRWVRLMEQKGLILREPDPRDGRRVHLVLADHGKQLMSDYLSAIYHKLTVA